MSNLAEREHLDRHGFYAILGVTHSASGPEIKKAYYKIARNYHPDRAKEDLVIPSPYSDVTEFFRAVTVAYDTLRDERRRSDYDESNVTKRDPEEVHANTDLLEKRLRGVQSRVFGRIIEEEDSFEEMIDITPLQVSVGSAIRQSSADLNFKIAMMGVGAVGLIMTATVLVLI